MFVIFVISTVITVICLIGNRALLRLIFGQVETDVMEASVTYFFYTALSFPFIALYNGGAAVYRAQGNSRRPMLISITSNFINIGGNALLIWVFRMGVTGVATATLVSRIFCAVVVLSHLRKPGQTIRAIVKPIFWNLSFIPVYGLRAAGDVKFSMTVSTISMWVCRVSLCVFLVRAYGFGPMAVWIGMFTDWAVRAMIFSFRFHSRKWLEHKVLP